MNPVLKLKAKVINQEIRIKVKKVKNGLDKYSILKIPVLHCYICNLMLMILDLYDFFCTVSIVTNNNIIEILIIVILY